MVPTSPVARPPARGVRSRSAIQHSVDAPEPALRLSSTDPAAPVRGVQATSVNHLVLDAPDPAHQVPATNAQALGPGLHRDLAFLAPTDPVLLELVETHRARQRLLRAQTILTQQMGAYCRRLCDGDKLEGAKLLRAVEATLKAKLRAETRTGKSRAKSAAPAHRLLDVASGVCIWLFRARHALRPGVLAHEKRIVAIVERLPIWTDWGKPILGLGPLGLGQIIGESVNPGRYGTPARLWKRMGVGLVQGEGGWERQRRVAGEGALLHGYSPERRSVLYNVGASLLKKRLSPYRAVYDVKRAEYEERRPDWTKGRRHLAAQRYMEKRLLRDLWSAWRRTMLQATSEVA